MLLSFWTGSAAFTWLLRLRFKFVFILRLRLRLELVFQPAAAALIWAEGRGMLRTTKANIEMCCFSIYAPLFTPLLNRDAKIYVFLNKELGLLLPNVEFSSGTNQVASIWVCFTIILYHTNHPDWKSGSPNFVFFSQKVRVTSTKFQNIAWIYSGKEATLSFHINHTNHQLWKRRTVKYAWV